MSATCKSCGADVVWAVTEKGKPMPVQLEPTGNVILIENRDDPREPPIAKVIKLRPEWEQRTLRYVSHFARCPEAAEWRRP